MRILQFQTKDEEAEFIALLARLLTKKLLALPKSSFPSESEWLGSIVGTTVADTWLVMTDVLSIEAYEGPERGERDD